jgi:hypothetical protein
LIGRGGANGGVAAHDYHAGAVGDQRAGRRETQTCGAANQDVNVAGNGIGHRLSIGMRRGGFQSENEKAPTGKLTRGA